jgi:hypothetical protein
LTALSEALAHPDARLAQSRIAGAQAGLEANAAFWPNQFQSSYTRTDNPMMVSAAFSTSTPACRRPELQRVPDVDDFNVRGIATLPVYAGGRIRAAEAAKFSAAAARGCCGGS